MVLIQVQYEDGSSGACSVRIRWCCISSYSYNCCTGYTFAYVRNADIVTVGATTSLSGAELDVIIPPKGGHGANAVEELGGHFVMMNTDFTEMNLQTLETLLLQTILEGSDYY